MLTSAASAMTVQKMTAFRIALEIMEGQPMLTSAESAMIFQKMTAFRIVLAYGEAMLKLEDAITNADQI